MDLLTLSIQQKTRAINYLLIAKHMLSTIIVATHKYIIIHLVRYSMLRTFLGIDKTHSYADLVTTVLVMFGTFVEVITTFKKYFFR